MKLLSLILLASLCVYSQASGALTVELNDKVADPALIEIGLKLNVVNENLGTPFANMI